MTDLDKVVRAVETCFDSWIDKHRNMGLDLHEVERMKRDALELLKEQEPVNPRFIDGKRNHFVKCGNCNFNLMHGMKFCPHCGRAVKWNV